LDQPGTLGAGNHFLEVQEVEEVYRPEIADKMGVFPGQVVVMIHSGSRGTGHQICTDFLRIMDSASRRYGYNLPDRQLACAPVNSPEGKNYYQAMACAANYALANRQCLGHLVREALEIVFRLGAEKLGVRLLYDVSHNIAKLEKHEVNGQVKLLCVHRKGATRALPPGHPDLPSIYQETGQPVIIPGDMGRASYLLVGTEEGKESFYSTCHGAGRLLSRKQAKKNIRGEKLRQELEEKGIKIVAGSLSLLAEEAPQAYKDVSKVVEICQGAGLSLKVARLKPLLVVKG
jgi:tRNA-splicing ligase RtcB